MHSNTPDPHSSHSTTLDSIGTPKFLRPLEKFLHIEAASGVVLLIAVIVALAWANWPGSHSYEHVWHVPLGLHIGEWTISLPLHFYINDVLMTIFFFVVGLEIRREIHEGALAGVRLAMLPLAAAVGGIVLPAGLYLMLNVDPAARQGWAIPTATDIAFAVGVLALLGKRVPAQLRILLLAVAIIDDIGAILVIAFFYSTGIKFSGLLIAVAGMALARLFNYMGIRIAIPYLIPGAITWIGVLYAGVHPTIAGVVLGLMTPVSAPVDRGALFNTATSMFAKLRDRFAGDDADSNKIVSQLQQLQTVQREMVPPVVRMQAALHTWVAFGVMPIFALANAGVVLDGKAFATLTTSTVNAGIVLGLAVGKPLGIVLASAIAVRLRIATLAAGISYRGLVVIGCLGGVGFTMSIFLAQLAFGDPELLATAKVAVLIASTIAAVAGLLLGRGLLRQ